METASNKEVTLDETQLHKWLIHVKYCQILTFRETLLIICGFFLTLGLTKCSIYNRSLIIQTTAHIFVAYSFESKMSSASRSEISNLELELTRLKMREMKLKQQIDSLMVNCCEGKSEPSQQRIPNTGKSIRLLQVNTKHRWLKTAYLCFYIHPINIILTLKIYFE